MAKKRKKARNNVIDLFAFMRAAADKAARAAAEAPAPRPAAPVVVPPRPVLTTPTPAAPQIPADHCWLPAGHAMTVRGRLLPHGLLYVGSGLKRTVKPVMGKNTEPALIDPALPAENTHHYFGYSRERPRTYGLSYSEMMEDWRAGYLDWLVEGRCAPQVNPGYPLLFFYGLERRALADAPVSEAARADLPAIEDELRWLLSAYGSQPGHGLLEQNAGQLLDILRALRQERLYEGQTPALPRHWQEIPPLAQIAVAQLAADDRPFPASWALALARADANCHLGIPAERCPVEFEALFALRYAQTWQDGIALKPTAKPEPMTLTYYPVNPTFSASYGISPVPVRLPGLSAVSLSVLRRQALRQMAMACSEELGTYSRWAGRVAARGGSRDWLEGWALLPSDLRAAQPHPRWQRLAALLDAEMGDAALADVPAARLLDAWQGQPEVALSVSRARALLAFLDANGWGVEPDARFGRPALSQEMQVVLFRQSVPPNLSAPAAHLSHSAVVTLIAALARADGDFPKGDWNGLLALAAPWLDARGAAAPRLRALLYWLGRAPAPPKVDKKTAGRIAEADRADALAVLTRVVARLEPLLPARLAGLETLYGLLEREPGEAACAVYAEQENAVREQDSGLVILRPALPGAAGFAIPPPPGAAPPGTRDAGDSALALSVQAAKALILDQAQVAARAHETAEVARLLHAIFAEESDPPFVVKEEGESAGGGPPENGLSAPLRAFVEQLSARPEWARAEWEAVAARLGLMPGAALDAVNEAAWDAFGEPVLEGEDPLCVHLHLAEKLVAGELAL